MKHLFSFFVMISIAGCAPKVLILQTPVVSMTKANTGSDKELKQGKAVEARWCAGDTPIKENTDGSLLYGMIDQVIWSAHKSTKASFFVNNRFYQQGACVLMSANVGSGTGTDESSASEEQQDSPPKKKKKKKNK